MPVIEKATSYVRSISNRGLERVISELLDISEPHHDLAVTRYKDIGNWLDGDEQVASYNPQIYPQGSFLLGTVTKSISDKYDYDLDFVIELEQPGDDIAPRRLKRLVESAIETYVSNSSYHVEFSGRRSTLPDIRLFRECPIPHECSTCYSRHNHSVPKGT